MLVRSLYWDALKVIAALAVVLLHVGLTPGFSVGVPCFTYMLVRLGSRRIDEGVPDLLRRHADQLLVPWLAWSLLYVGLRAVAPGESPVGSPRLSGPLIGGHLHLWFLPFAFTVRAVSQVAVSDAYTTPRRSQASLFATLMACAVLAASCRAQGMAKPIPQWAGALPAAFVAFSVRVDPRYGSVARNCALLVLCGLLLRLNFGDVGLLCLLVSLDLKSRQAPRVAPAWVSRGADLSWPIYLIHPAAIAGGEEVLGITSPAWLFVFVILTSALASGVLLGWGTLSRVLLRK